MRKLSISSLNINLAVLLGLLCWCTIQTETFGQGATIPRGTATDNAGQPQQDDLELPEGVKYRYPLLNGLALSVNIFEPVMGIFLNDYASCEATGQLNLHHRFFPEFTFGMGKCDDVSDDLVGYTTKLTPFYKIGIAYNLKYNDIAPENYYFIFLRYGFAHSTADITNLTFTDGYWHKYGPVDITGQKFNSHWLEIGFGIKVRIWRQFSMGWDLYYKPLLSDGATRYASPYYIPGYGTTSGRFGFGYRISYDIF